MLDFKQIGLVVIAVMALTGCASTRGYSSSQLVGNAPYPNANPFEYIYYPDRPVYYPDGTVYYPPNPTFYQDGTSYHQAGVTY